MGLAEDLIKAFGEGGSGSGGGGAGGPFQNIDAPGGGGGAVVPGSHPNTAENARKQLTEDHRQQEANELDYWSPDKMYEHYFQQLSGIPYNHLNDDLIRGNEKTNVNGNAYSSIRNAKMADALANKYYKKNFWAGVRAFNGTTGSPVVFEDPKFPDIYQMPIKTMDQKERDQMLEREQYQGKQEINRKERVKDQGLTRVEALQLLREKLAGTISQSNLTRLNDWMRERVRQDWIEPWNVHTRTIEQSFNSWRDNFHISVAKYNQVVAPLLQQRDYLAAGVAAMLMGGGSVPGPLQAYSQQLMTPLLNGDVEGFKQAMRQLGNMGIDIGQFGKESFSNIMGGKQ